MKPNKQKEKQQERRYLCCKGCGNKRLEILYYENFQLVLRCLVCGEIGELPYDPAHLSEELESVLLIE